MINERSQLILQWFVNRDFCVYLRPHQSEGEYTWRITVEKMGRQIIYVVFDNPDINVAIKDAYTDTKKKLGIKTRKKARRKT